MCLIEVAEPEVVAYPRDAPIDLRIIGARVAIATLLVRAGLGSGSGFGSRLEHGRRAEDAELGEAAPLEEGERAQLALELGELGLEHALLAEHLVIGVAYRGRSQG